jgi:metal-responsive CopG/Arc/MetJ family transcriptional regulator
MADNTFMNDQIKVTLPSNMVAQIDAQVGGGFVDREEFIRSAIRHYVEYLQEVDSASSGRAIG